MAVTSSNGANGQASYAEIHNIAPHFVGGNRLENAPASKVKDFVAQHDGHTVITNVSPPTCLPATSLLPRLRAP